ncbi:UNVERIFIED_CONTAM: hypothetical protein K2H54_071967 [Gekko kuhli]
MTNPAQFPSAEKDPRVWVCVMNAAGDELLDPAEPTPDPDEATEPVGVSLPPIPATAEEERLTAGNPPAPDLPPQTARLRSRLRQDFAPQRREAIPQP